MTGFEKAYEVEKKTEYDRGYKEGWEAASSESP